MSKRAVDRVDRLHHSFGATTFSIIALAAILAMNVFVVMTIKSIQDNIGDVETRMQGVVDDRYKKTDAHVDFEARDQKIANLELRITTLETEVKKLGASSQ